MQSVIKFKADDGSEWSTEVAALKRDRLCARINQAMRPLGPANPLMRAGKGWVQHDLETVNRCKDAIVEICLEEGLGKSFPVFNNKGRNIHPLSVAGRILDDYGGPLNEAWNRFCRIDPKGREHQQCYFAYTGGPDTNHYCVENRT